MLQGSASAGPTFMGLQVVEPKEGHPQKPRAISPGSEGMHWGCAPFALQGSEGWVLTSLQSSASDILRIPL